MPLNFSFRPRLLDAVRGYDRSRFFKDLGAGATVGIVALPLAMAFAIAALGAEQPSMIAGAEAVDISYPGFFATLETLCERDLTGC